MLHPLIPETLMNLLHMLFFAQKTSSLSPVAKLQLLLNSFND